MTVDNAELLDRIDDTLVGLLAVAYFGPAEQGTAKSVEQVCAAEVLLFRLRQARRGVADLRDAFGLQSPARRDAVVAPVFAPGGPAVLPAAVAGIGRGGGRAGGAPGAATFALPLRPAVPTFEPGRARVYGLARPSDEPPPPPPPRPILEGP